MRNIRADIAKLFDQYAHQIVYVRRNEKFRCDCYSERSRESTSPTCLKCLGTSYQINLEKHRVRRSATSLPETKIGSRKQSEVGNLQASGYVYYFEHYSEPKSGDLLFEVEWLNGVPKTIKEKFEVGLVEPMKGNQGRVEFYQAYVRATQKGGDHDGF